MTKLNVGDRVKYSPRFLRTVGRYVASKRGKVVTSEGYILPGRVGIRWDDETLEDHAHDPEYQKHVADFGVAVHTKNLVKVK